MVKMTFSDGEVVERYWPHNLKRTNKKPFKPYSIRVDKARFYPKYKGKEQELEEALHTVNAGVVYE